MADEFKIGKIDVEGMRVAGDYLKTLETGAARTSIEMAKMQSVMMDLAKAKGLLAASNADIVDPNTLKILTDVEKSLVNQGASRERISELAKEEELSAKGQLLTTKQLTDAENRFVQLQQKALDAKKIFVKTQNGIVALGNRQEINASKTATWFKKQGSDLAQIAKSMTSVDLSLAAMIALIIGSLDRMSKLAGWSKQVAAQWSYMGGNIKGASDTIVSLYDNFKLSREEAAGIANQLARGGMSAGDLNDKVIVHTKTTQQLMDKYGTLQGLTDKQKTTQEIISGIASRNVAREKIGLMTIQEQDKYTRNLAMNFGISRDVADTMVGTLTRSVVESRNLGEEAKKVGESMVGFDLSVEEVAQDWAEISDKVKMHNTDLLATMAIYNTLVRQSSADKIGLGKIPVAVRRNLAKSFSGMSAELSNGWKAALGKGITPADAILEFERAVKKGGFAEQIKRSMEFISKNTFGSVSEKLITMREALAAMFPQMDKDSITGLAEAMSEGAFSGPMLEKFTAEVEKNRTDAAKLAEKEKTGREALVKYAGEIANNLTPIAEVITRLVNAIVDELIPAINSFITAVKDLAFWKAGEKPQPTKYEAAMITRARESVDRSDMEQQRRIDALAEKHMVGNLEFTPEEANLAIGQARQLGFGKEVEGIAKEYANKNRAAATAETREMLRRSINAMSSYRGIESTSTYQIISSRLKALSPPLQRFGE